MRNRYTIDLPSFSGPLDLLLHLIDRQELDITALSLLAVTEQYLAQIELLKENRVEQLIDFLVVAARLVQIKSRALLPHNPVSIDEEDEEEDPAEALLRQLRAYKRFKRVSLWLQERESNGWRTYLRLAPPPKMEGRLDMSGVGLESLLTAVRAALARAEERDDSVSLVRPRRLTIEKQIAQLRRRVKGGERFGFHDLLGKSAGRVEIAVTLLAVLELIKRREIQATQTDLFGPIEIGPFVKDPTPAAARS